jgi:hypothetical protein
MSWYLSLMFVLYVLVAQTEGKLSLNAWTDSSCTVRDTRLTTIDLPSQPFVMDQPTCVEGSGVSGLSNVQWLAYICSSGTDQSAGAASFLEYTYSVDGKCPYNASIGTSTSTANWSINAQGGGNPTCRRMQYVYYNSTTGVQEFPLVYGSLICDSNASMSLLNMFPILSILATIGLMLVTSF